MKTFSITLPMTALVCAVFFASCAGQSYGDRPAARQRPGQGTEASLTLASEQQISPRGASVVHAAAPAPVAAEEAKGDAAKGKEVFEQCAICHNVDSDEEKMGPSLKGLFKKAKLKNEKPVTEENVRAIIKAGGNGMPGYEELLSAEEMNNLIAYLKTI